MPLDPDALDGALRPLAADPAKLAVCLDFDGTLSPIVDDPERAEALPGVAGLLERLAGVCAAVVLISGRPAGYLADHVHAAGLRHLGLYGLEEIRDGSLAVDPAAERERPAVRTALHELTESEPVRSSGAFVEDKGLSVAVHLRRVEDPDRWAPVMDAMMADAATAHGLKLVTGKLVWELRPSLQRDKGDALRQVIADSAAEAVIMAGDDLGDLPAFAVVEEVAERGGHGLRVAVRSAESPQELLDRADLVVDGPEGSRELLERLSQLTSAS